MKTQWICLVALSLALAACNARMSTVGGLSNSKEDTQVDPPPPPPVWPEGKLSLSCQLIGPSEFYFMGQIGMIDDNDENFVEKQYRWVKYADEGWVAVDAYFVDHNPNERPIKPPKTVEIEYYLFLRPDWRVPENFYEIRRKVRAPFKRDQKMRVRWKFTDHVLECGVQAAQKD